MAAKSQIKPEDVERVKMELKAAGWAIYTGRSIRLAVGRHTRNEWVCKHCKGNIDDDDSSIAISPMGVTYDLACAYNSTEFKDQIEKPKPFGGRRKGKSVVK